MKCQLCGARVRTVKTVQITDTMIKRTLRCTARVCPFTTTTFEEMPVCEDASALLDDVIALLRNIARTVGGDTVLERLAKLSREINWNK